MLHPGSVFIKGANGHSSVINGEYLEDTTYTRDSPVFRNGVGQIRMWYHDGRWCIGRSVNVGTDLCRAFVQSDAEAPEKILGDWMVRPNDGVPHAVDPAVKLIPARRKRHVQSASGLEPPPDPAKQLSCVIGADTDIHPIVQQIRETKDTLAILVEADESEMERSLQDEQLALVVEAALGSPYCRQLLVSNVAWGARTTETWVRAMEAGKCKLDRLSIQSSISSTDHVRCLLDAIPKETRLQNVGLAGNHVGIDGLRSFVDAVKRCTSIRSLDLFDIGPYMDGASLGCFVPDEGREDVVLLRELYQNVEPRRGSIFNEAFMEDCHGGGALLGIMRR